jgi:hypothetical protein
MMKCVEETSGGGELILNGTTLCKVGYQIRRFQGMTEGSGLPIPGLHRIEGLIEFDQNVDPREWIGVPLNLKFEDGRVFGISLVSADGRILSEGHGPSKCLCC